LWALRRWRVRPTWLAIFCASGVRRLAAASLDATPDEKLECFVGNRQIEALLAQSRNRFTKS
ncbi:MAG: hypothetical protein WEB60_13050, partial [Terrimicrobiaceae bacterium]